MTEPARPPDQRLADLSRFKRLELDHCDRLYGVTADTGEVVPLGMTSLRAIRALSRRLEELEGEKRGISEARHRWQARAEAAEREANTLKDALAEALDYLEEYRDVLARERGGGTPLDRMGYILLHRQGKAVLERLKPLAARETEVVFTPESWDRIDRLAEQDDSVSARPKPYTPEDHASSQAARRYENHLEQIKDHGP